LVTLRARWVTLRARWVTLRARWVTLRARWVTLRARWVVLTQNGAVLNHLANHFLVVGEYEKVIALADASFKLNGSAPMRAESCVLIARAYHAQVRRPR
jgi:hypothetical protein